MTFVGRPAALEPKLAPDARVTIRRGRIRIHLAPIGLADIEKLGFGKLVLLDRSDVESLREACDEALRRMPS